MAASRPFLLPPLLLPVALGSLQGLYLTIPPTGQLRRLDVDVGVGVAEDVGRPLDSEGFASMPDCVPSAVDQTGKWYFTLARRRRPANDTGGRWNLVGLLMADATVRVDQPLPDSFPESLEACDHTLDTDGGWMVLVSAVVGRSANGTGGRLLVVRFDTLKRKVPEILVDVGVGPIGLGGAARYPTSSFFDIGNTLFLQFERGVARCNLTSGKVDVALKLEHDDGILTLLPFDPTEMRISAVLQTSDSSSIAYFSPESPSSTFKIDNVSIPTVDRDGSAVAYLSDRREIAVLNGTTLAILSLNGTILNSSVICGKLACPSSLHYEPFVFHRDRMTRENSNLPVVELLRQSVPCEDQDKFLRVDRAVWTRFLEKQDGFMSKQTWASPERPTMSNNCSFWQAIHWASRELWKSIPSAELVRIDQIFVQRLGYRQKMETLPTPDGMGFDTLDFEK